MAEKATQPAMTIAEQMKVDEVITAMPREWQKRALKNIDPDLIIEETQRRLSVYMEKVNEILKVEARYRNKGWDLITLWNMLKAFEQAVKMPK